MLWVKSHLRQLCICIVLCCCIYRSESLELNSCSFHYFMLGGRTLQCQNIRFCKLHILTFILPLFIYSRFLFHFRGSLNSKPNVISTQSCVLSVRSLRCTWLLRRWRKMSSLQQLMCTHLVSEWEEGGVGREGERREEEKRKRERVYVVSVKR